MKSKSTYRTCELCLYFYFGRNRKFYCRLPGKLSPGKGYPEKAPGDSCQEWHPKDGDVLATVEAQEDRDREERLKAEVAEIKSPRLFAEG